MQASRPAAKSSLSPARTRLVGLMQRLNFGRIDELRILDGEPLFDPPPLGAEARIVRNAAVLFAGRVYRVRLGAQIGVEVEA